MRLRSGVFTGLVYVSVCASAIDARAQAAAPPASEGDLADTPAPPTFVPSLAHPPPLAAALEGYAGVSLLTGAGDTRSRAVLGGLLRLRYRYFQIGGTVEFSDSGQADALNEQLEESWRSIGGFAGVWLPFERWIAADAAVGVADRRFTNSDRIYGPDGLNVDGPAVTWRFGISDRFGKKPLGVRLGAALLGAVDLHSHSAPYERTYLTSGGGVSVTRGTTDLGGVSIALVVGGGFELGGIDKSWQR